MVEEYDGTQDLYKSVVRFTADWCGPCKAFAPMFNKVADNDLDKDYVVVDVDVHPEVAGKFGIKSIPALFIDGVKVPDHVGWARSA